MPVLATEHPFLEVKFGSMEGKLMTKFGSIALPREI
jgi:hypothetical protein